MDVLTLGMAKAAAAKAINAHTGTSLNLATLSDSLASYGEGFPTYVEMLSQQKLRFTASDGTARRVYSYPGQDSAYLLSQVGNVTSLVTKPDACLVQGGTNDAIAAVPLATTLANLDTICRRLEAVGIRPIMSTTPPLGGSYQHSGKITTGKLLNVGIRRLAQRTGRWFVDPYAALVNTTSGSYIATYDSGDNVHPSPAGIKVWAQKIITDVEAFTRLIAYPVLEVGNDTNGLYKTGRLGAGGGTFGAAASAGLAIDMTATTAPAGYTPTLEVDAAGFNWQRITAASPTASLQFYQGAAATVSPGDLIHAALRVRMGQDLTGSNRLTAFMRCYNATNGLATEVQNITLLGPIGISRQTDNAIALAIFKMPATANRVQLNVIVPPVSGTYDIAQPSIYDFTALGIA